MNKVIIFLNSIKNCDDFDLLSNEYFEDYLNSKDIASVTVSELINFMEDNPYVNYGIPGRLVHYIEKTTPNGDDYSNLITSSLKKKPTYQILLMYWRVHNSLTTLEKEKSKLFLNSLLENCNDFEKELINDIANFSNVT